MIEKNIIKSKVIINSDIMIIIYHYDISLRLYNIRGISEYSIYIIQLLKNILKDINCSLKLIFFYDIYCRFKKYIKIQIWISCFWLQEIYDKWRIWQIEILNWLLNSLSIFIIEIFHYFTHNFPYQIEFSSWMIEEMNWINKEDSERFWSDSWYIIPANRIIEVYIQYQILINLNMMIGWSRIRNFSHASRKKLHKILKIDRDVQNELTLYYNSNNINIEILWQEILSMKTFLLQFIDNTIHIEDNICEHLIAIEDLCLFEKIHDQTVETDRSSVDEI